MPSLNENVLDHIAAVLLGGPLDGQRFRVPRVPPGQSIPVSVSIPLKQPASSSPRATYLREGDDAVGGYYVFLFEECTGPNGESVLYAPEEVMPVASAAG